MSGSSNAALWQLTITPLTHPLLPNFLPPLNQLSELQHAFLKDKLKKNGRISLVSLPFLPPSTCFPFPLAT